MGYRAGYQARNRETGLAGTCPWSAYVGWIEGPRLALVLPRCSISLEPLQRGRQKGPLALYKHDRRGASLLNHRLERVWSGKAPSSRPPTGQQVFLWVGPGAVHS